MERLKSQNRVAGVKQTKNAILNDETSVVYIACDADASLTDELFELCRRKGIEAVTGMTRKELSKACSLDVLCTAAAIINNNK